MDTIIKIGGVDHDNESYDEASRQQIYYLHKIIYIIFRGGYTMKKKLVLMLLTSCVLASTFSLTVCADAIEFETETIM